MKSVWDKSSLAAVGWVLNTERIVCILSRHHRHAAVFREQKVGHALSTQRFDATVILFQSLVLRNRVRVFAIRNHGGKTHTQTHTCSPCPSKQPRILSYFEALWERFI